MTREYKLPSGEVIPPDLLDQIHEDGRAFEAGQTPAARSAVHLRKIATELRRIRAVLAGDDQSVRVRQTVALEIMVLSELGFTSDLIRATPQAQRLMRLYGLIGVHE